MYSLRAINIGLFESASTLLPPDPTAVLYLPMRGLMQQCLYLSSVYFVTPLPNYDGPCAMESCTCTMQSYSVGVLAQDMQLVMIRGCDSNQYYTIGFVDVIPETV